MPFDGDIGLNDDVHLCKTFLKSIMPVVSYDWKYYVQLRAHNSIFSVSKRISLCDLQSQIFDNNGHENILTKHKHTSQYSKKKKKKKLLLLSIFDVSCSKITPLNCSVSCLECLYSFMSVYLLFTCNVIFVSMPYFVFRYFIITATLGWMNKLA